MTDSEQKNKHIAGGPVQNSRRSGTVCVQACGEVACPPDIVQFTVSINSSKVAFEAAQASVQRRSDYVLQVLRNNGIKDGGVVCSSEVARDDEMFTMATEIRVQSECVAKCEAARNLLVEKLDTSVHLTPLTYNHSAESKDKARQEAFKRSADNAKAKALSIAQAMGVQLGVAAEVVEQAQDVHQEEELGGDSSSHYGRYKAATLHFSSRGSVVFESLPARSCTHKKCRKH